MVTLNSISLQIVNAVVAVGLYVLLQRVIAYRRAASRRKVQSIKPQHASEEVQHRGDSATESVGLIPADARLVCTGTLHAGVALVAF